MFSASFRRTIVGSDALPPIDWCYNGSDMAVSPTDSKDEEGADALPLEDAPGRIDAAENRRSDSPLQPQGRREVLTVGACLIALIAFVASLATSHNPASDLFWQMRAGRDIVGHHAVPRVDAYTWTVPHHPWILHEWGMCVLLWLAFHAGGYATVFLFEIAILSMVFAGLYLVLLRETGAPLTALGLTVLAEKMSSPLISPRPHLFTYLFLVASLAILTGVRRTVLEVRPAESNRDRTKTLWLLPALCALWANLHGGVIVAVALLMLYGVCDLIEWRKQRSPALFRLAGVQLIVASCCALAIALNPYGFGIYSIFTETVSNSTMPAFVSEWVPLDFHSPLGYLTEALILLAFGGMFLSKERRSVGDWLALIVLAHEALAASRNVPVLALVGLPIAGRHIQSAILRVSGTGAGGLDLFGARPPALMTTAVAAAIVLQSAAFARAQVMQTSAAGDLLQRAAAASFDLRYFPQAACRFMVKEGFPTGARLYNDYNFGGYIIWTTPQYPVSISTQTDVYFGRVLDDYAELDTLPFDWESTIDRYGPDVVLLSTDEPQSRLFVSAPNKWALCYVDRLPFGHVDQANVLIFVRKVPKYADLIARCRKDCPECLEL